MVQILCSAADWEWSLTVTCLVFEDTSVAELVAEELNKLSAEERLRRNIPLEASFAVKPLDVIKAQSESRVRGIIDQRWPLTPRRL